MKPRHRAIYFALALGVLVVVGRASTESFRFLLVDFWFTSGLLLLILLAVLEQPHFSKDANVFVNGITGLTALLAVQPPNRDWLWHLFFGWSISLISISYTLIVIRSRRLPAEGPLVRVAARFIRHTGRPQALFSAFFLWGVMTQFSQDALAYRGLLLFWCVFMILNLPGVASSLVSFFEADALDPKDSEARIRSHTAPRVIELELNAAAPKDVLGMTAEFVENGDVTRTGSVVDVQSVSGLRTAKVILASEVPSGRSYSSTPVIRFLKTETSTAETLAVGIVCPGTTTSELHVGVNADQDLTEGRLLTVRLKVGSQAYYQIVAARVAEESLGGQRGYHQVAVRAAQLGSWDGERASFDPIQWVAPPGEGVSTVPTGGRLLPIPKGQYGVGRIPFSSFPVHVDLEDVVTHNTAILGVTGSGKSFLSFHLTRGLIGRGIKVLILDASRQHFVHLSSSNPVQLKAAAAVGDWLNSPDPLAVYQFAPATNFPSVTADFVTQVFDELQRTVTLKAGHNEPARVVIVLEEAHSLVPEWNQVAQKGDEQHVNRTARVLLQGRKYGLGCVLISQRTANVTKTMLNQCNTIFALQSFDQTGLDFLHNYMGAEYAQALSTLPPRHAVLVGKASSSARPVILSLDAFA